LSGASGIEIRVDGKVCASFWLGDTRYDYDMLVGDLQGLDMLLGLDWMKAVGAQIDFATMQATFGPRQWVQLRDTKRDPATGVGYVKVLADRKLLAGHTTKVKCSVLNGWTAGTPAVFEPQMTFGEGIHVPSCLIQPEPHTGSFEIGIMNMTTEDWNLDGGILLGHVQTVAATKSTVSYDKKSHTRTPTHKIWQVTAQTWQELGPDREEEGVMPVFVRQDLVPECDSVPRKGRKHAIPQALRRVVSRGEGRGEAKTGEVGIHTVGPAPGPATVYRVYNCQGEEISGEGGVSQEEVSFNVSKPRRWGSPLLVRGRSEASSRSNPTLAVGSERKLSPNDPVSRLPEHFRCMMPAPGELDDERVEHVVELLEEYKDIFVGPDGKVGFTHKVEHRIDTQGAEPIKMHPRRKSFPEKEAIEQEVRKMLDNGQIMPSKSPWGAPVVLVKKKDGTLRFCIDFRRLNEVTKKDAYPLPRIEECLDALNGCKYFSTMDLASGYWQVAMDPLDREKTAFTTHMGLFEWVVMPFGLCNAPATFMRLMEMILADIVWSRCLVYLDDIVAFGDSFETAYCNLEAVFVRLRAANLKLKPKKCELFRQEVEYLGHVITPEGVKPSPGKVDALHDWVAPKNLAEVRTFLGFTGYYRRFVSGYSEKALPLTTLTKKDVPFRWGDAEETAFQTLRQDLMQVPLLHYVDPKLPFYLDTDASNYAIGAVLSQRRGNEEYPLAFASKTLNVSRQRYCTTKKELYAVVFFMRYFQGYTCGQMVNIRSDHSALRWLMKFDGSDAMYSRWIFELQGYMPWHVEWRPGKLHWVADHLSRVYRDCKIEECLACERMFRKNRKLGDDLSDDSDEDRKKPDDDKDDHPNDKDYALWDLRLHRRERHDHVFAITRAESPKHKEEHRTTTPGNVRSMRVACSRRRQAKMYLTRVERTRKHAERKTRSSLRLAKRAADQATAAQPSATQVPGAGSSHPYKLRTRIPPQTGAPVIGKASRSPVPRNRRRGRSKSPSARPPDGLSSDGTKPPARSGRLTEDRVLRQPPPKVLSGPDVGKSGPSARREVNEKRNLRRQSMRKRYGGRRKGGDDPADTGTGQLARPNAESGYDTGTPLTSESTDKPQRRAGVATRLRSATGQGLEATRAPSRAGKEVPSVIDGKSGDRTTTLEKPGPSKLCNDAKTDHKSTVTEPRGSEPTSDHGLTPAKRVRYELGGDDGFPVVMFRYTTEDWVREQSRDVVLSRIKELKELFPDEVPSESMMKCEAPEVRQLCRSWDMLCMHEGVLCRELPTHHSTIGRGMTIQRLVPACWRLELFLHVHKAECRHMGYDRVYDILTARFYWYNMSQNVREWLGACQSCQQAKTGVGRGRMPLRQDIVGAPMARCAMDIAGPMPTTSEGFRYILVIQDYFSKWVEMFPMKNHTAVDVADVLVGQFFTRYGICERLHSDQGSEFDSALMHEVMHLWGIDKTRTSPFAPWSNGMVERSNRSIKSMLRQLCWKVWVDSWDSKLPFVRMALNNTKHSTTGYTPHLLFFSRCENAVLPSDLLYGKPRAGYPTCLRAYVHEQQLAIQEVCEMARRHIAKAASIQRSTRERGGLKIRSYQVGQEVWRLWPPALRDKSDPTPWRGPYKVLDVDLEHHDVKLRIPGKGRGGGLVDKWVNVSNVKPVIYTKDGQLLMNFESLGSCKIPSMGRLGTH
jgi:hypothetical protein